MYIYLMNYLALVFAVCHNHIIFEHHLCTCIQYNLLHDVARVVLKSKRLPSNQRTHGIRISVKLIMCSKML